MLSGTAPRPRCAWQTRSSCPGLLFPSSVVSQRSSIVIKLDTHASGIPLLVSSLKPGVGSSHRSSLSRACGEGWQTRLHSTAFQGSPAAVSPLCLFGLSTQQGLRMRVPTKPLPAGDTWEADRFPWFLCTADHSFFQTIYSLQFTPHPVQPFTDERP